MESTSALSYDLVVVGSGIAGLYAALQAAPHGRVLLVTKGALEESNTRYAQGGIAVSLQPGDSPELHMQDTVAAGDGLCDTEAVMVLTRDAPARILDLLALGVPFDRERAGLAWTLEAAHSRARVLHAGGDATGASIERILAAALRDQEAEIIEHAMCTEVNTDSGRVTGIRLLMADGRPVDILAPAVLLATGGFGRMYRRTTNPEVATGDGMAIAYRAGAELMDLEFVQFHPTALAVEDAPSFLISEAVRGEGGILRDASGYAFMTSYHPDGELAPRDVVARAIHQQMSRTASECVYLDVTHLDRRLIENRFPNILRFCRSVGVDPVREPIPVGPAAHYAMGGIRTDLWGRSTVRGLLACGESACACVHGANRLASNSLLEGLVFAHRAVNAFLRGETEPCRPGVASCRLPAEPRPILREKLADVMWDHVSLVRSQDSLRRAADWLDRPEGEDHEHKPSNVQHMEDENLTLLARLLVAAALHRTESRGAHFRSDFPHASPGLPMHTVLSLRGISRLSIGSAQPVTAHA